MRREEDEECRLKKHKRRTSNGEKVKLICHGKRSNLIDEEAFDMRALGHKCVNYHLYRKGEMGDWLNQIVS